MYNNQAYEEVEYVANKGLKDGYDNQDAICHNYLGVVYEYQGKLENALKQFEKAYKLDPEEDLYEDNIESIKARIKKNKKGFLGKLFRKN